MSEWRAGRMRSIWCAAIVACSALAGYLWLYDRCVRMPRVSLRCWAWPYYAARLPMKSHQGIIREADYCLPPKAAEIFFRPAYWLDRQLHPQKWADEDPAKAFGHVK